MNIITFRQRKLAVLLAAAALPATMMPAISANGESAVTNGQPAAARSFEFMPEIERVLPGTGALGERAYLDFAGGVVAVERTAEDPRRNRQLHRDLKADLTPGAEQWTGIGLQITPATDELWNAPADQVVAALAEHLADAPPALPVTQASWLFKTADGALGLMRVEGMVPTPGGGRGMKIVYKLARTARPGELHGLALDYKDRPVAGARVFLVTDQHLDLIDGQTERKTRGSMFNNSRPFNGSTASTDSEGRFSLRGVGASAPRVVVASPDGSQIGVASKPGPDGEWKIKLPEPALLSVRYDIPNDTPEAEVRLTFIPEDGREWTNITSAVTRKVRNRGQIFLTNLTPGKYDFDRGKELMVGGRGEGVCLDHTTMLLEAGRTKFIEAARPNGQIVRGEINGLANAEATGAFIFVLPVEEAGLPRYAWTLPTFDITTCGKDGQFQTAQLSPGTYEIVAQADNFTTAEDMARGGRHSLISDGAAKVTVTAGVAPQPVKIELYPRADAGGR